MIRSAFIASALLLMLWAAPASAACAYPEQCGTSDLLLWRTSNSIVDTDDECFSKMDDAIVTTCTSDLAKFHPLARPLLITRISAVVHAIGSAGYQCSVVIVLAGALETGTPIDFATDAPKFTTATEVQSISVLDGVSVGLKVTSSGTCTGAANPAFYAEIYGHYLN